VKRDGAIASVPARLVAVLMFGLMPLAVSQGDALRWYPVFALLSALFVTLYLVPRDGPAQLWSSAVLGLAASTDFSAILLVPPLLIYRYGLQLGSAGGSIWPTGSSPQPGQPSAFFRPIGYSCTARSPCEPNSLAESSAPD